MNSAKKKTIIFLAVFCLLAPLRISALQIDWPASPAGTSLTDASTITELTKYSYEWAITLGILAFFVSIIINGVRYMTSTGNPGKMDKSRKRIQASAAGLALLLGSWIILNFLNPRLTTLFIPDPNKPVVTQLADYDAATLGGGDCSLVLIYDDKDYKQKKDIHKVSANETFPQDISFVPRSVRVLKELPPDEKTNMQKQLDKENIARAAEGKPAKTLENIIEETYGEKPYTPPGDKIYVNSTAGCTVQFYRKDPKLLIPAFGTNDVFVFQFYSSNPDFSSLYSDKELEAIKSVRVTMKKK